MRFLILVEENPGVESSRAWHAEAFANDGFAKGSVADAEAFAEDPASAIRVLANQIESEDRSWG